MYRPSPVEQLAIQARLNFILGPREYDRLFLNFECGEMHGTSVQVFARNEYNANQIALNYPVHVAIAIECIIKRPIRSVDVRALPRGLRRTAE
jgi:hypothetical protein